MNCKTCRIPLENQIEDNEYTDKQLAKMIRGCFNQLKEIEQKDVWIENGTFFIDSDTVPMGFTRYKPDTKRAKKLVEQISLLIAERLCL